MTTNERIAKLLTEGGLTNLAAHPEFFIDADSGRPRVFALADVLKLSPEAVASRLGFKLFDERLTDVPLRRF